MTETANPRIGELHELLANLAGHRNALIRSAVRIAMTELDTADLADDPAPHYAQVTRILDAVLNPETEVREQSEDH